MTEHLRYVPPDFHYVQLFATTKDGLIGRNNGLPWNYPEDLAYFKEVTSGPGKAVLMGYKTWESLPVGRISGEKLPARKKIVVTRKKDLKPLKDTIFVNTTSQHYIRSEMLPLGINRVFIIGGAEILESTCYERTGLSLTLVKDHIPLQTGDVKIARHVFEANLIDQNFVRDLVPGRVSLYRTGEWDQESPGEIRSEIRAVQQVASYYINPDWI